MAAVGAVGAVLGVIFSGGSTNPAVVRIPNGPTVNVEAFAGQGRLAFVSRNSLWVVDATSRSLRKVAIPVGLRPLRPLFSPDGKWLAFLETTSVPSDVAGGALGYSQVWLVRRPA